MFVLAVEWRTCHLASLPFFKGSCLWPSLALTLTLHPSLAALQLSASAVSFKFPEPGYLEGVKTKDKAILKMQKVRSLTNPLALQNVQGLGYNRLG